MDRTITAVDRLAGTISVPGDKSISHRALILGSLCEGAVLIHNLSTAADVQSTARCLTSLGVDIERKPTGETVVHGRGVIGFNEPGNVLNAGNSGTTMRLLSGLLAGQPFYSVITGDGSLRRRPMQRIIGPLSAMGAYISAREDNTLPPLTIKGGSLSPINYSMPVASAQVKSAILIAGLFCQGQTLVRESIPTRDHSERMMRSLGANVVQSNGSVMLESEHLTAQPLFVPGDISSAIFFVVAAVLHKKASIKIENVGLNPTRTGCLDVLKRMGARIEVSLSGTKNGEPYGTIEAESSDLHAVNITPDEIPSVIDEIPILSLAASQAEGRTVISGAGELRFKESNRLAATREQLSRLGASMMETEDGLVIEGSTRLVGAEVDSVEDHRMAMTLAIAGLMAEGRTLVRGTDAVTISYPEFFETLDATTGKDNWKG